MTESTAMLVIAIFTALGGWTVSVIAGAIWLTAKFRAIEVILYKELGQHRREIDERFVQQGDRIQRLEIREFGVTQHPL